MKIEQALDVVEKSRANFGVPGFSFDAAYEAKPIHGTLPRSLADKGRKKHYSITDRIRHIFSTLGRQIKNTLVVTLRHFLLYGTIFAAASALATLFFSIKTFAFSFIPPNVLELALVFVLFFVSLFILNWSGLLGYKNRRWKTLTPRLHAVTDRTDFNLAKWEVEIKTQNFSMPPNYINFGFLNIRYFFTEKAFYIEEGARNIACGFSVELITKVDTLDKGREAWAGPQGTPGVLIAFGQGDFQSELHIHGAYFEENSNFPDPEQYQSAFVSSLQKVCPNILNRTEK